MGAAAVALEAQGSLQDPVDLIGTEVGDREQITSAHRILRPRRSLVGSISPSRGESRLTRLPL
jgi:hypothetical protein